MTTPARAVLLVGVPVVFAGLLWLHPMVGDWEGLRDATMRFQLVHVAMVLAICLLALGIYVLLDGLPGRAAAVGRVALIPFVAFYVPYLAFEGVALGVLGQELNDLPAAQRDAVAPGMVEDFARNPILGEPGVFWALGSTAWNRRRRRHRARVPRRGRLARGAGPARAVGADRRPHPAGRDGGLALLRGGRLDGAPGPSRRGRRTSTAGRPSRRVGLGT
jgi:hypothetical protein